MKLTEIENLSHEELKAQKDALIEAAAQVEIAELAARYVKARTDAKQRDEKLSEQGRTIDALSLGLEAAKEQNESLKSSLAESDNRATHWQDVAGEMERKFAGLKDESALSLEDAKKTAAAQIADLQKKTTQAAAEAEKSYAANLAVLRDDLAAQTARAERLKAQALRNNSAINTAAKALNDAISNQQVEDADSGN